MATNIIIPPAALEAGAREIAEQLGDDWDDNVHTFCGDDFQMTPDGAKEACREIARAAFRAMLETWEGAKIIRDDGRRQTYAIPAIILPLPMEKTDDKA